MRWTKYHITGGVEKMTNSKQQKQAKQSVKQLLRTAQGAVRKADRKDFARAEAQERSSAAAPCTFQTHDDASWTPYDEFA